MIIFLLTVIITIAFFTFCSAIILLPEGINSDVITVTRIKMCAVLSAVLMVGCMFAICYIENSPENIKAKIEKCMEKYPEFADRCGIAAVR